MFSNGSPWLGQVPLVSRTGPTMSVARVHGRNAWLGQAPFAPPDELGISVVGGRIMRRSGSSFLEFYIDSEIRDAIEAATGLRPAWPFMTTVGHCNPLPGTVPALGEFTEPMTGEVCWLDLPEDWNWVYMNFLIQKNLDAAPLPEGAVPYDPIGTPPYWGEWGVVGEGGEILDCGKVGPFDTKDEAFSAAADAAGEHGATALPGDGWAQVKDSTGKGVGPIT